MNTGMMDACNLAWKLALVAGGRAPDGLLDSYGQERVPVASGVLQFTNELVGLLTMRNPLKRAVRDTVLPLVTRLPAVQRGAARRLSQVSVAYPAGPLVLRDSERMGVPGEVARGPASESMTSCSTRRTGPPGCTSCCAAAATYW